MVGSILRPLICGNSHLGPDMELQGLINRPGRRRSKMTTMCAQVQFQKLTVWKLWTHMLKEGFRPVDSLPQRVEVPIQYIHRPLSKDMGTPFWPRCLPY